MAADAASRSSPASNHVPCALQTSTTILEPRENARGVIGSLHRGQSKVFCGEAAIRALASGPLSSARAASGVCSVSALSTRCAANRPCPAGHAVTTIPASSRRTSGAPQRGQGASGDATLDGCSRAVLRDGEAGAGGSCTTQRAATRRLCRSPFHLERRSPWPRPHRMLRTPLRNPK